METHSRHLKLGGILSQSLRLLGGKPLTFLGIGLIPAGLLWASFGAIVLGLDHAWRSGEIDLIATWRSLSPLVRAGFILSLLASLALVFRGYAASVLVTSEWRQGRSISTIRAYSQVRRKSLRILWICFLCGLFTGRFAVVADHPAQKPEQPPLNLRDILFEDFDLPLDVLCSISVATRPRNSASSRRWLLLWLPVRRTVERVRPFSMAGWAAGKRREELPDWKLGLPS